MWFKINHRKSGGVGRQVTTPLKMVTKSKKSSTRFHWPRLSRSSFRRKPCPSVAIFRRAASSRAPTALSVPPTTTSAGMDPSPARKRIRCGTAVIPIMRASAIHLPPPTAVKRRPTTTFSSYSLEPQLLKVRRLSRCLEHFNPIYDDVYSDSYEEMEDEAIYEEIAPPKRRTHVGTASYLDLMQVSAVVAGSPPKPLTPVSPASSRGVYALHGGDWVSIASGTYDDVASSSDSESDEGFDIDVSIYGWAHDAPDGRKNIPWPTAAYGESPFTEDPSTLRWMYRESYIIH